LYALSLASCTSQPASSRFASLIAAADSC
jgi:hypothetical protein